MFLRFLSDNWQAICGILGSVLAYAAGHSKGKKTPAK